jgi:uncharacterized protein (TIGR02231 family)
VAEPIVTDTAVRTVTFFEDRAEVVRVARVRLPAGRSRVSLGGMTLLVDDRSLFARVEEEDVVAFPPLPESSAPAALRAPVASVVAARVRRTSEERPSASREYVAELEEAKRSTAEALTASRAAEARAEVDARRIAGLVSAWSSLAGSIPSRADDAVRELDASYATLDASEKEAYERAASAREETQRLETEHAHLVERLIQARKITPRHEALVDVDVDVTAERESASASSRGSARSAERELTIVVTYRTPCALWRPEHRARLTRNADGTCEITLVTLATAWQRTGEKWSDVTCRFSTARPARPATMPMLQEDVLTTRPKSDEERKRIIVDARQQAITTAGIAHGTRDVSEMPGVDDGGEAQWLTARSPATITSDGRPCRVELGERRLSCEVALMAWPELAGAAHIRATGTLPGPGPLLAGPVVVARGSEVVGRTQVKFTGAGEALELGFGVDDGLRVRRRQTERRKVTPITGTQHVEREVTIYVSNLAGEPRRVSLVERVPVSEVEEVTIDVEKRRELVRDPRDGFVTLTADVGAGATSELVLRYRIEAASNVVLPA